MTTLEKIKPVTWPMVEQGNGSTLLESIVGKLPPELKKYESYLEAVLYFRQEWARTGVYPTESRGVLAELRDGTPERELRENILGKQLDRICRVYPVSGVTGIKPRVNSGALALGGEVRLGEIVQDYVQRK